VVKEFCVACVRMTVVMLLAYLVLFVSSCAYDASFHDCAVACADDSGCPDGLACGSEGLCRTAGATAACSRVLGSDGGNDGGSDGGGSSFPSCTGLATTCGPNGTDDCCSTATPIPGGTYYRSYDLGSDGMFSDMSYPATVSSFVLDKYEVTVGRFRAFVNAGMGTQVKPPAAGAGAHAQIADSGWDASWDADLESDAASLSAALACDSQYATWTTSPGANEVLPINCVTWYEAEAFCAWDGAFLPTESEWNYAAAGGNEQRAYPWSSPAGTLTVDCSYANYDVDGGPTYCVPGSNGAVATMNRVGNESPKGDGAWGQSDLGGNAWEWTLDWYATYVNPCDDCANLAPTGSNRVIRGGDFTHSELYMRAASRGLPTDNNSEPSSRTHDVGFRCARP
jgi:formylglycine-generating enzyme required for sulfatase activity